MMNNNPAKSNVPLRGLVAALLATAILPVSAAQARDSKRINLPGYVDGSRFAELAKEDGTLVEVNISGALLKVVSKAVGDGDENVGALLAQIESVSAVVVEIEDDDAEEAAREVKKIIEQLERDGWEHIARVREEDSRINVSVLYDDEVILGLVVMVIEDDELVFANIAGRIDMGLIGSLAGALDIPGLDDLSGINLKKQRRSRDRE